MYRNIVTLLAATIVFASCSDKEKELTQNQIKAKVDSLVGVKVQELARQSAEDLDRRMSIEVKAKADSIVQAQTSGTTITTTKTTAAVTQTADSGKKPATTPVRIVSPAMPAGER